MFFFLPLIFSHLNYIWILMIEPSLCKTSPCSVPVCVHLCVCVCESDACGFDRERENMCVAECE